MYNDIHLRHVPEIIRILISEPITSPSWTLQKSSPPSSPSSSSTSSSSSSSLSLPSSSSSSCRDPGDRQLGLFPRRAVLGRLQRGLGKPTQDGDEYDDYTNDYEDFTQHNTTQHNTTQHKMVVNDYDVLDHGNEYEDAK